MIQKTKIKIKQKAKQIGTQVGYIITGLIIINVFSFEFNVVGLLMYLIYKNGRR